MLFLNVLSALYKSYVTCGKKGLVDQTERLNTEIVLLPIYHTNKRSNNGKDIIEVTLDEDGEFVSANYLEKNSIIIFPVTEDSISRSSGSAPHPLVDELSYLTAIFSESKHQDYLSGLEQWVRFNNNRDDFPQLKLIYAYIQSGDLVSDIIRSLYPKGSYKPKEKEITIEGLEKPVSLSSKDFITFKVETSGRDLTISKTKAVHQNFIDYTEAQLSTKQKNMCNISGEMMYCSRKHRGLMGNSKMISVSNNRETYYGRFREKEDITQIGYRTSQQIHLMLKYLLENSPTSHPLDPSASIVLWPSQGIDEFDFDLLGEHSTEDYEDDISQNDYVIHSDEADVINNYIKGKLSQQDSEVIDNVSDAYFYVAIVDKVSNGRISIKYFRSLHQSDLVQRVSDWYATTNWQYGYGQYQKIKTPSLLQLATVSQGSFERGQKRIVLRKEELKKKTMERLLPCIIDGKKIPLDIVQKMMLNVSNRVSYHESWPTLLSTACSVIKKYKWDYYREEVTSQMNEKSKSRDYLYGGILAVLENIEVAATNNERVTNAEKYWSMFMQSPAETHLRLQAKVRPYLDRLKRGDTGIYIHYMKHLEKLESQLHDLELTESQRNRRLNEDFVLGYYAQRKQLFTKTSEKEEE